MPFSVTLHSSYHRATSHQPLADAAKALGKRAEDISITKQGDVYKMEVNLRVRKKESTLDILPRLESLPGVELESLE